jgi:serine phosphatase RsbU (regulator of sigma subunit)/anti-sigma regulatory factor (Ser/Thr protein kinase)
MTALSRPFRRFRGGTTRAARAASSIEPAAIADEPSGVAVDIPESDPLFAYLQAAAGPVELARLELASPALQQLRDAGVALVVPLVTQGELIGTLNLGPRLSEQDYSTDDRRLLASLAAQAAPAIRVAQLVREQAAEAAERERYEQELKVAQLIQQQFLPRQLPDLREWQIAAFYGPARVVGGDFYDFIDLGEGQIGVVVGDVTDKGVPAALVMARTHSILRAEAPRLVEPGRVLARANELLVPEMPAKMFVTCLYGVLDTATGRFRFANAGHNLPCIRTPDGVVEPRATGMPLGLLPGISYEEAVGEIGPGDEVLLFSDGMVEVHAPDGEMYGFPRLRRAIAEEAGSGSDVIDRLLERLHAFTGPGWEQEDDITVVALRRSAGAGSVHAFTAHDEPGVRPVDGLDDATADPSATGPHAAPAGAAPVPASAEPLLAFSIPGAVGHERAAMDRVAGAVTSLGLRGEPLERLKTAVAETVMNALEYGSLGDPDVPVDIRVDASVAAVTVRVTDRALSGPVPNADAPDLEAKLAGLQKPRGWGLFLIRHMVDGMEVSAADGLQTVALTLVLDGHAGGTPS